MFKLKEFILIILVVFAVIILIYGMVFFKNNFTGKVSLELDSNYKQGQPLDGILKIALKEGELIPLSSKIIIENNGQSYEYELSKFISDNLDSGNFYVEGKSFLGVGKGYGIKGEKTIYPKVDFALEIFSKSNSSVSSNIINKLNETKEPQKTNEKNISSNKTQKQVSNEIKISNNTSKAIVQKEIILEQVQKKEQEKPEQQELKTVSINKTTSVEPKSTITGNIISGFFSKTFNFFLGMTGQVSLELKNEVKGEVSSDNEFVYELNQGQTAEILSGSVKTDSKKLSDGEVNLKIKDNKVIVTTKYSKTEKGFGKDYIGNNSKVLSIDLSKLNFVPEQGDLKISLVYGNEEIVSLKTSLVEGKISLENKTSEIKKENKEEQIDLNKTKINLTNITSLNITESNVSVVNLTIVKLSSNLTDKEREVIVNEFGNVSVKITKAEKTSQGTLVRFELNDFWVEHSYSSGISDEKLKEQVNEDKIKFLKDLAKKFSKKEIQNQEVKGLIGNYKV